MLQHCKPKQTFSSWAKTGVTSWTCARAHTHTHQPKHFNTTHTQSTHTSPNILTQHTKHTHTPALSICFSAVNPNKLYCGYNNKIRIYDLERPGREHTTLRTFHRAHKQTTGQRGIISCMHFNPDKSGLFAAGSYSRNVGLYDTGTGKLLYNMQGQKGGVTQVQWSPEGCYLYSGMRVCVRECVYVCVNVCM
jgi:WD40 repeat protein